MGVEVQLVRVDADEQLRLAGPRDVARLHLHGQQRDRQRRLGQRAEQLLDLASVFMCGGARQQPARVDRDPHRALAEDGGHVRAVEAPT